MTAINQPPNPSDAELVLQGRQGDQGAFTILLDRHFDAVFAVALSRLRHREEAEDLAQEVFLRAWLHLGALRTPESFGAWVVRMTRNLASSRMATGERRSRLARMVPMEESVSETVRDSAPGASETLAQNEETAALLSALEKLPAADRELVLMHFQGGESQRGIAERTGTHHTTVGRRLEKALARLRGFLLPAAESVRPRPAARQGALALVASLAAMDPAAREAVAKIAAQSLPAHLIEGKCVPPALEWLPGFLHPLAGNLATGVVTMSAGNKFIAVTAAAALFAGGGYVLSDGEQSVPPAPAVAAAAATTPVRVEGITFGAEGKFLIPWDATVKIEIKGAPADYPQFALVTARRDKGLEVVTTENGETETGIWNLGAIEEDGMPAGCAMSMWTQGNYFEVSIIHMAPEAEGIRLSAMVTNRPDLIADANVHIASYRRGEVSEKQLKSRLWKLYSDRGLVPRDPVLAETFTRMLSAWRP